MRISGPISGRDNINLKREMCKMLHIVWMILKIIGLILAVVLGIALLGVGMILFVPVRYRIDGEIEDTPDKKQIEIRFFWFLHLLSGHATYKDGAFSFRARLFWKQWKDKPDKSEEENYEQNGEQRDSRKEQKQTKQRKEKKSEKKEAEHKNGSEKNVEKKHKTFRGFCDKIKSIIEKKEELQGFLQDGGHKKAFGILKKEVFRLWKVIRPRTLRMWVHFGFEDPYLTGKVLAALSMLYPWYGDSVEIEPNFEEKVLEGNLHIRGRLYLVWLLVIAWNIYFNDCVMNSYRDLKKLGDKA